ncbi:MAG: hypothetical protein IPM70_09095 [Proteobacteria bacterium]|nr:hypothetical protein [Pseudomonadota bacterium]
MATTGSSALARWPSVACTRTVSPGTTPSLSARFTASVSPSGRGKTCCRFSSSVRFRATLAGTPCSALRRERLPNSKITSVLRTGSTLSTPGMRAISSRIWSSAASENDTITSSRCAISKVTSMMRFMASGKCCVVTISPIASAMPATVVAERRGKRRMRRATMRVLPSSFEASRSAAAPSRPKAVGAGGASAAAGARRVARHTAWVAPASAASSAMASELRYTPGPASKCSPGIR